MSAYDPKRTLANLTASVRWRVSFAGVGGEGIDRVWQYVGALIVTVTGWMFWCMFTHRDSLVPTVEVMALFIGALAFDIWRNS